MEFIESLELDWLGVIALLVSIGAAWFAARQAAIAKRQADISVQALRQARLTRLYSSFDIANQAALDHPEILHFVHGIEAEVSEGEARNLAYLSVLLDGYQNYWSDVFNNDFAQAGLKLREQSTFLSRVLSRAENQARWRQIQSLFYGDFDREFIAAIDAIIAHENEKNAAT